jgi:hypothetical protein
LLDLYYVSLARFFVFYPQLVSIAPQRLSSTRIVPLIAFASRYSLLFKTVSTVSLFSLYSVFKVQCRFTDRSVLRLDRSLLATSFCLLFLLLKKK